MDSKPIIPHGEALRRAVIWLADQPERNAEIIEEAARRFDLSPTEEELLLHLFTSGQTKAED